jgi:hypothetical protein
VNVTCKDCGKRYDDADCNTICPHPLIMSMPDLLRKKAAIAIMGKRVRFAHMPDKPENYRNIMAIGWNGMITLAGEDAAMGEFAPHLFISEYDPINDGDPPTTPNGDF